MASQALAQQTRHQQRWDHTAEPSEHRARAGRAEAQANQQSVLAEAKSEAARVMAKALAESPEAEEAVRLMLAQDWMAMGQQMANSPAGSVLMVDPQSPASLIAALKQFQQSKS